MTAEDESTMCALCEIGHVTKRLEQVAFRQRSDKGYVHCSVTVQVGTCSHCHAKSTDPDAQTIFDAAFKREYDKLP